MGTLVLVYPLLLGVMYIFEEFDATTLPNGVYIAKGSVFSGDKDIWLWRANGTPIYEGGVEFICFNDSYIEASPYSWDQHSSFIYSVKEDRVVTTENRQEYNSMVELSNLRNPINGSCNGYFKGLVGVNYLLKEPWLLQEPRTCKKMCRINSLKGIELDTCPYRTNSDK